MFQITAINRIFFIKMEIYCQSYENYENGTKLIIHEYHLIKGSRVIPLHKLTSTEIYSILASKVQNKPSFNDYFKNLFNDYNIDL